MLLRQCHTKLASGHRQDKLFKYNMFMVPVYKVDQATVYALVLFSVMLS